MAPQMVKNRKSISVSFHSIPFRASSAINQPYCVWALSLILCVSFELEEQQFIHFTSNQTTFTVNNQMKMEKRMKKSRHITHVNIRNEINKWQICGQNFVIIFLLTYQTRHLKWRKDTHELCVQCAWLGWMWLRICKINLHTAHTYLFNQMWKWNRLLSIIK